MNMQSTLTLLGASGFGAIIGWFVYYINRYRKGDVQFSDLVTLIGIIGGASITSLFGKPSLTAVAQGVGQAGQPATAETAAAVAKAVAETDLSGALFGAYGIGLFCGFFAYFVTLIVMVNKSGGVFGVTWFLDGRRKMLQSNETVDGARPTVAPMGPVPSDLLAHQIGALHRLGAASNETLHANAARIIEKCEAHWEANKGDCNKFVIAVAAALGVTELAPPADKIVDTITGGPGWRQLADGIEAQEAAEAGEFVVAGLRGGEQTPAAAHGHVAVVTVGPLAHGKYPTGYWGSIAGNYAKKKTLNYSWNTADRDKLHYAARQI